MPKQFNKGTMSSVVKLFLAKPKNSRVLFYSKTALNSYTARPEKLLLERSSTFKFLA